MNERLISVVDGVVSANVMGTDFLQDERTDGTMSA